MNDATTLPAYECPELVEIGEFQALTMGGGFIFDEGDDNEAFYGSTTL